MSDEQQQETFAAVNFLKSIDFSGTQETLFLAYSTNAESRRVSLQLTASTIISLALRNGYTQSSSVVYSPIYSARKLREKQQNKPQ